MRNQAHPHPVPVLTEQVVQDNEPPAYVLMEIPDAAWQEFMAERYEAEMASWD